MKTTHFFMILLLIVLVNNCKKESADESTDSIKITSVTPSTGLIDGDTTAFNIKGEYVLSSHSSGIIWVGFNNGDDVNLFVMHNDKDTVVEKGKGQFNLDVAAKVKDWGSYGAFSVYVNISPNPVPSGSWKAFAFDFYKLQIKQ